MNDKIMIDIADVKTLTLQSGQILVVKLNDRVDIKTAKRLKDQFSELFPNNSVLIIDSDIELMVIDHE